MSDRRNIRGGYTAIELMLVLSIIAVLSAMTAPSVVSSLRTAAVGNGAEAIEQIAREARLLAMSNYPSNDYYGVVVYCAAEDSGRLRYYAALTHGPDASVANILRSGTEPVLQMALNRNLMITTGSDYADYSEDVAMAEGEAFGWMHQYRTGHVVVDNLGTAAPVSVGTSASPTGLPQEIGIRTLDNAIGSRFAAYPIGLTGVEDLEL